jgi:hypothetical protein
VTSLRCQSERICAEFTMIQLWHHFLGTIISLFLGGLNLENHFVQAFDQLVSIRMEYTAKSVLSHSEEYKELIQESSKLFSELQALLPLEHKQILQDYDTYTTLLQGLAETLMYTQGLKDGVSLHKMLEKY